MPATIDKDVIAALPLDQQLALLDDLRFRLDRNKAPQAAQPRQTWSPLETDVWTALGRELMAELHIDVGPLHVFTKSFGIDKYRQAVERLDAYVQTSCGESLSKVHKIMLFRTMFNCMIEHLLDGDIPVTASSIMSNAGRIPQAVNAAFPGYAAARLLHRVVPLSNRAYA